MKLDASIPEIEKQPKKDPDQWQVGKGGWTLDRFSPDEPPAERDLERWITESFYLLAPKKVIALLDS